jgi:rhamnogalacturonan endolyase
MAIISSRSLWYVQSSRLTTRRFSTDCHKVHRESQTGDAVQLNMIHGTHYQAIARDSFADGKIWGPWLWYINDGSKDDAAARWEKEEAAWPYKWFENKPYQSRGKMQGKLLLSDGRPAAGAAVFLGDNRNTTVSTLDQGQNYYYTTYADKDGKFVIDDIRTGTYALYAWGNGDAIGDVTTTFTQNDVVISQEHEPQGNDLEGYRQREAHLPDRRL